MIFGERQKAVRSPIFSVDANRRRFAVTGAGMYQSAEAYAQEAAAVCELGFSAYKYRPARAGRGSSNGRAHAPRSVGICLDAHGWWRMGDKSYSSATIDSLARAIAPVA